MRMFVSGRESWRGRDAVRQLSAERLAELYATCSSVFYAPVDEDFGMGPYEAFLSGKPVITTTDAGGPLDVVADRRTGLVVEPRADAVADAVADWAAGFVFRPSVWLGIAVAIVAVVLIVIGSRGRSKARAVGSKSSPAKPAVGGAKAAPAKRAKGGAEDDEFADIEDILRRHGIE